MDLVYKITTTGYALTIDFNTPTSNFNYFLSTAAPLSVEDKGSEDEHQASSEGRCAIRANVAGLRAGPRRVGTRTTRIGRLRGRSGVRSSRGATRNESPIGDDDGGVGNVLARAKTTTRDVVADLGDAWRGATS